jgi:hypothetical protein
VPDLGTAGRAEVQHDERTLGADAQYRGSAGAARENRGRSARGAGNRGAVAGIGELALELGDGVLVGGDRVR